MPQRRVLIVEDDDLVARALMNVIRREVSVARAESVAGAKRLLTGPKPWDAVIVDIGLPDGDGLDLMTWARSVDLRLPALVVTGTLEPKLANRAHLLDVEFAYKPDVLPNVKAFIRRVCSRPSEEDATSQAVATGEALARQAHMTPREIDVVRLVAEGVPRAELARRLRISENTVKTRIRSLLEKANLPNLEAVARAVLVTVAREATGNHALPSADPAQLVTEHEGASRSETRLAAARRRRQLP